MNGDNLLNIKDNEDDQSPKLETKNRHFELIFYIILINVFNIHK